MFFKNPLNLYFCKQETVKNVLTLFFKILKFFETNNRANTVKTSCHFWFYLILNSRLITTRFLTRSSISPSTFKTRIWLTWIRPTSRSRSLTTMITLRCLYRTVRRFPSMRTLRSALRFTSSALLIKTQDWINYLRMYIDKNSGLNKLFTCLYGLVYRTE